MTFPHRRKAVHFMYSVNGTSLKISGESIVDLGIRFDKRLFFHSLIERIICKDLKMLEFFKRTSSDFTF